MTGSTPAGSINKKQIKNLIGFRPGRLDLYQLALIPKSSLPNTVHPVDEHNERLEYLGDSILEAVITDLLYHEFPDQDEGSLTKIRSNMVSRDFLNSIGEKMDLEQFIKPPAHQNLHKKDLLGDTVEALIGAIFLDRGYRRTRQFILRKLVDYPEGLARLAKLETDYKSQVIELAHKHKLNVRFSTRVEKGESFSSTLYHDSESCGVGKGASKKEAEQNAACQALKHLQKKFEE